MEPPETENKNFHLLIEVISEHRAEDSQSDSSTAAGGLVNINIPGDGALLAVNDGCLPRIADVPGISDDNTYIFQPFWNHPDSHLLMVSPGGKRPLINALPAPPLALLNVKDEILFPNAAEGIAHVSIFNRARLGPPPEHGVGRKCPICRSKLLKQSLTYTCYRCGQVIHYKRNGDSEADHLNCANICDHCPVCHARIHLDDGYVYLPEFLQKRG